MTTIVAEQPEGWIGIEKRMTDGELEQLVAGMAEEYGFGTSEAEFAEFEDFKVKWTRSFGWILLQVSDYIADAPEKIIEVLMRTVFRRITGEQVPYPKELRDWIASERFLEGSRPMYLERHTEFSQMMAGNHRDLAESYGRLVSRGLLERDPGLVIGWADMARSRRIGTASIVMRTAMVSRRLDSEMVEDEAFDYALYNLVCQAESGLTDESMSRRERIEARLAEYPEKIRPNPAWRGSGSTSEEEGGGEVLPRNPGEDGGIKMTVAYDGKLRLVSNGGMDTRIEPCCRGMDLALIDGCIRSDYD